jgi:hypothetical protein
VGHEDHAEEGQERSRRAMVAALAADPQATANSVVVDRAQSLSMLDLSVHGVVGVMPMFVVIGTNMSGLSSGKT